MTRPSTTASLERALAQIEAEAGGRPDTEARAALAHLKSVLALAGAAGVADEDGGGLSVGPRRREADDDDAPSTTVVDAALAAQVDALKSRLEAVEAAVQGLDGPARELVAAGLRDAGLGGAGDEGGGRGGQ